MADRTSFVVSALVRREDRLLLVEEREPGDAESTWMLPGGKVEVDETLADALRRELLEETGLRLAGTPRIAFLVDVVADEGRYSAITFECQGDGTLQPNDPDALVLSADWLTTGEALRRLGCVHWYDCVPLERYLAGQEPAGATYVIDRR